MWEAKKLVSGAATRQNDERAMSYLNRKTLVLQLLLHLSCVQFAGLSDTLLLSYVVSSSSYLLPMQYVHREPTKNVQSCCKFTAEPNSWKKFKVDQHFLKLWTNIESHVFMAHRVVDCCHWHYAQCLLCNSFAQYNFRASHLCYDYASTYNNGLILTSFTLFATIS